MGKGISLENNIRCQVIAITVNAKGVSEPIPSESTSDTR